VLWGKVMALWETIWDCGEKIWQCGKKNSSSKLKSYIHTTVLIIFVAPTNTLWERRNYQIRLKLKVWGDWENLA
jgi:hypothetical protein